MLRRISPNRSSVLFKTPNAGTKTAWRTAWATMMKELAPQDAAGGYSRPKSSFSGSIGTPPFAAATGRYHVFVGNACPWCHRIMLTLAILGLDKHVSYTWLTDDAERASRGGWVRNSPYVQMTVTLHLIHTVSEVVCFNRYIGTLETICFKCGNSYFEDQIVSKCLICF